MDEDSRTILDKILQKCQYLQNTHGCIIWTGATSNAGRYGRMRNPFKNLINQPSTMSVHRLVYLLHNINIFSDKKIPNFGVDGEVLHVSHICHNSLCVNIDHLILEPQKTNNEREACNAQKHCLGTHLPICLL